MDHVVATTPLELQKGFLPAPEQPADWPAWRERLAAWSAAERARLGPVRYDRAAQAWTARLYAQGFVMLWDNELIDHATGRWQVDALLDRAEREFGGYDLVTLWNNYPLSGIDCRHQLALYEDLPGGRAALRAAVARFHARGVRVFVDHKPWIPAPVPGFASVEDAFVDLVRTCDLDGIYLDCSAGPDDAFREALAAGAGPGRAFQSEAPARTDLFGCESGSWQQMTDDTAAPGTYRNRWLDRHHLVAECRRYFHDPIRELQRAWMNGGAFVIWENVFGYWADHSPRCKTWMRLLFPAQRRLAAHFIEGAWLPHVGGGLHGGLYVSRFTHDNLVLHTAVNRRGHTLEKNLFRIPSAPGAARYVDVISGATYTVTEEKDGHVTLAGRLERDGLAGVLGLPAADAGWDAFLAAQRLRFANADWTALPWSGEHRRTPLPHVRIPAPAAPAAPAVPPGMVRLPDFHGPLVARYRMRECGFIAGVPDEKHVYDAFEQVCTYTRTAVVRGVAIDAYPVTNDAFARFLADTGYRPADARGFLRHWVDGAPPPGLGNHPVVHVSRADALAYAAWAGKRLPTGEEWQHAAQAGTGRRFPWGDEPLDATRANQGNRGTSAVDAHPAGRTPEGVWDLCGNVWEMTDSERTDGHTRYHILQGGCWHVLDNSHWMFDTGARPADWGAKHILLCEAWDRCATVGFRCAFTLAP